MNRRRLCIIFVALLLAVAGLWRVRIDVDVFNLLPMNISETA